MIKGIARASSIVLGILVLLGVGLAGALTARDVYREQSPAVVLLMAGERPGLDSIGTGAIIRSDGLVITNAHLLKRARSQRLAERVSVYLKPDMVTGGLDQDLSRRFRGRVVAYELKLDLALIRIDNPAGSLPTLDFADSDAIDIGEQVFAIGHPEQGGLWSLTAGMISARRQNYGGVSGKHLFQTDASINRGNSGGPLLDQRGRMVGINALIARRAADGMAITDVNFAIQSNVALQWLAARGYDFEPAPAETPDTPPQALPASQPSPAMAEPLVTEPKTTVEQTDAGPAPPDPEVEAPALEAPPVETPGPSPAPVQPGEVLTPKRPYRMESLLREMGDMEDLMEEMRGKIRRRRTD